MDRIITSSRDRTSLLSTHKVLRNTYFMLSLTLAFSAITATASTVLMLPSPGLILTLVGMYGLMFLTYKTADKPVGILSAFAFTGFLGYILGPILNAYLCRNGRSDRHGAGRYRAGVLLLLGLRADHA
jgi:modulator of FtsH protease